MQHKKEYLISSILFALGTVIWIINIYMNYQDKGIFNFLSILQSCCAVLFSVAAIVNFIWYRRDN